MNQKAYVISLTAAMAIGAGGGDILGDYTAKAATLETKDFAVNKELGPEAAAALVRFLKDNICADVDTALGLSGADKCDPNKHLPTVCATIRENDDGTVTAALSTTARVSGTWTPGKPE